MTKSELISKLTEDCRTTQTRVEDFLAALGDVFTEALKRGETVNLAPMGVFRIVEAKNGRPRVSFYSSADLRAALDLPDKYDRHGPLCATCKTREREKGRTDCRSCRGKRYRGLSKKTAASK